MKIAFCTTCKNRTQHLRQTLPRNMRDNPNALFVVLDYDSEDDLLGYLSADHSTVISAGKLVVYSYRNGRLPGFRMSHAKNVAHRCGMLEGADILVNLDADNLTGSGMDQFIIKHMVPNTFLWANMIKGEMVRGVSGRIVVSKGAFLKSGGYDEKFEGWASDDKDINIRLKILGYQGVEIDRQYLLGIPHNDKVRFKEYPHLAQKDESFYAVNPWEIKSAVVNGGQSGCGIVYRNFDFSAPTRLGPAPCRIFGIGMHKTATTSLHHALQALGYDSWHWSSAHAAKAIWREMNELGYSRTLERYHALSDLPIPLLCGQLDTAYPGSKFILTERDEDNWLDTVKRHFDPATNPWRSGWDTDPFTHRVHSLLYHCRDFDTGVFLDRYRRHNAQARAYFQNRAEDLLIMNMDHGAGWSELCAFLDVPIPDERYPRRNVQRSAS